jgi:hypothetical protein
MALSSRISRAVKLPVGTFKNGFNAQQAQVDNTFVEGNSVYLQQDYPELYAKIGLVNAAPFRSVPPIVATNITNLASNGQDNYVGISGARAVSTLNVSEWNATISGLPPDITAIAYGQGKIVYGTSNGIIKYSTDNGDTWNDSFSNTNDPIYSIIYSDDKFLYSSGLATVKTSTDAVTWEVTNDPELTLSANTLLPATNILSLVYNPDNGIYVYAGTGGTIASSTDGINWVERNSTITTTINSVVYGNQVFVAGGASGKLLTSTDGTEWSDISFNLGVASNSIINSVVYGNGDYAVFSTDPTKVISVSADDLNSWYVYGTGQTTVHQTLFKDQSTDRYYASASNNVFESLDPSITLWKGTQIISEAPGAIIHNGTEFIKYQSSQVATVSQDGVYWQRTQRINLASNVNVGSIKWLPEANLYVLINTSTSVRTSTDGLIWSDGNAVQFVSRDVDYGNSVFVATGGNGLISSSTDAITWTARTSGTTTPLNSIAFGNGVFVAVGDNEQCRTSTNGITWTARTVDLGPSENTGVVLRKIVYKNNLFLVSGDQGRLATSTDGITWVNRPTPITVVKVIYNNGLYVRALRNGQIHTSTNAKNWNVYSTGAPNLLRAMEYAEGIYMVVGDNGYIATSTDAITWTQQASQGSVNILGVAYTRWSVGGTTGSNDTGIWAIVGTGGFYRTSGNKGVTWANRTSGVTTAITAIAQGKGFFVFGTDTGIIRSQGINPSGTTVQQRAATNRRINNIVRTRFGFAICENAGWSYWSGVGSITSYTNAAVNHTAATDNSLDAVSSSTTVVFFNPYSAIPISNGTFGTSTLTSSSANGLEYLGNSNVRVLSTCRYNEPDDSLRNSGMLITGDGFFALNNGVGNLYISYNDKLMGNILDIDFVDGKYLFVGDFSSAATTTDFNNWEILNQEEYSPISNTSFSKVAIDQTALEGEKTIVLMGSSTTGISTDSGQSWKVAMVEQMTPISGVANNDQAVFVGSSKSIFVLDPSKSTFGYNLGIARSTSVSIAGIAYGNNKYAVTGGLYSKTFNAISEDGLNWNRSVISSTFNVAYNNLTYVQNKFYAVGADALIETSTDGVDWYKLGPCIALTRSIYSVAYGNGNFIFGADEAASNESVGISSDGVNWKKSRPFQTASIIWAVHASNSVYLAAETNVIYKSNDGITWKGVAKFFTNNGIRSFRYLNGLFIASGGVGNFDHLYSQDGETWSSKYIFPRYAATTAFTPQLGGNSLLADAPNIVLLANLSTAALSDIVTSTDADNWNLRFFHSANNYVVRAVTYGDGLYVAVGERIVLTSTDAKTWKHNDISTSNFMNGIAYGNGVFVAAGSAGRIMVSSDPSAEKWSENTSATDSNFSAVAYGNNKFVIVGASTLATIDINPSIGSVLAPVLQSNSNVMHDVAFDSDSNIWMIVGNAGYVATSTNGTTWTTRSTGSTSTVYSVTYGNGIFMIGQQGAIRTTTNLGVTWQGSISSTVTQPLVKFSSNLGLFVIVQNDGSFLTTTSTALTLTGRTANTLAKIDMAYGNDLYVSIRAATNTQIQTSTDLVTWTTRTSNTTSSLRTITYSGGLFVVGGNGGTVVSSTDGITWSSASNVGNTNTITNIEYINGNFVYVTGNTGVIGTSTDGITWETKTTIGNSLTSITYSNQDNLYMISGINATLLTSTDLVTWVRHGIGRDPQLPAQTNVVGTALDYYNGLFLHGSNSGLIRTSTDGSNWIIRDQETYSIKGFNYFNNKYYAYGSSGIIKSSTDGVSWVREVSGVTATINSLLYYNLTDIFVQASNRLYASSDFNRWIEINGATFGTVISNIYANNVFYVGTLEGNLLKSPDLRAWTTVEDRFGYQINAIARSETENNVSDAVFYGTSGGNIVRSFDDVIWDHYYAIENSTGITTSTLNTITYGNNLFVAAGNAGVIISSTNGRNWLRSKSPTSTIIQNIYFNNGEFFITGNNGLFLTTTDNFKFFNTVSTGVTTTIFSTLRTDQGLYIIGRSGADIQTSTNLTKWSRYGVTITDVPNNNSQYSVGNALVLQTYTNLTLSTNAWPGNILGITTTTTQTVKIIGAISGTDVLATVEDDSEENWRMYASADPISSVTTYITSAGIARIYAVRTNSILYIGSSGVFVNTAIGGLSTTSTQLNCIERTSQSALIAGGNAGFIWRSADGLSGTYIRDWASNINTRGICTNVPTANTLVVGNSGNWGYGLGQTTIVTGNSLGSQDLNSATFNGSDLYVIVGNAGIIATSSTITGPFTLRTNTEFYNQNINKVIFGGGLFVFGGEDGIVASSTDGISWAKHLTGTNLPIRGLGYDEPTQEYFYLDSGGSIRSSTDFENWELVVRQQSIIGDPRKIIDGNNISLYYSTNAYGYSTDNKIWQSVETSTEITDITFGNNEFVMTFANGIIRTSTDTINWTNKFSGTNNKINAISYNQDSVVYVGDFGEIAYGDNFDDIKFSQFYDVDTEFYVPEKLQYSSETLPIDGTALKTFVKARR